MKYVCANCGNVSLRWEGKCNSCGEWGTYEQEEETKSSNVSPDRSNVKAATTVDISEVDTSGELGPDSRIKSEVDEFDRVLGGGFVPGEVVLLTGEPGVGKSTLLLQMCIQMSRSKKVLYVSGEESVGQIYGRYQRVTSDGTEGLKVKKSTTKDSNNIDFPISSETQLDRLLVLLEQKTFDLVVIDSIQSLISSTSESFPGSITQVRNCGYQIVDFAKKHGVIMVVVGQINKSGVVAGPKVLEHMVDAVLHMEGDKDGYYKVLRSFKNRYGSTNEIGVFKMSSTGIEGVVNPSEIFLSEEGSVSGSVVGAIVEGSRVMLLEVQALVADHGASPGPLRRVANGIRQQRLEMLCAVMSRRGNLYLGDKDVFINVLGGMTVNEPSLDLAICAAIRSSFDDSVISSRVIYMGEVGLTGGVKRFVGMDRVVDDSLRLGYEGVAGPINKTPKGLSLKKVVNIKALSK